MTASVKEQARQLIDTLPDNATWEDVAYAVDVRRKLTRGKAEMEAGRGQTLAELRKRLGLDPL